MTRLVILLVIITWSVTMSKYAVVSEWCSDSIKGSNVCQENVSTQLHYNKQPVRCAPGKMNAPLRVFTPVSLPGFLTMSFNS